MGYQAQDVEDMKTSIMQAIDYLQDTDISEEITKKMSDGIDLLDGLLVEGHIE